MKAKRIVEIVERYSTFLAKTVKPKEFASKGVLPSPGDVKAHVAWLCEEIPSLVKSDKKAKAVHLLGFAQGAMWAAGLVSIAEQKEGPSDTSDVSAPASEAAE